MERVRLERKEHWCEIVFQREDKPVNVLDLPTIEALEGMLDELEKELPKALVLRSEKERCFIAGADVDAIAAIEDAEQARQLAERGQALCRRIERLPCPSVAVVRGAALGGGLEIALACDWIVAVDDPSTQLGLPEIRLGIHPGFGGTVRLPRRVGWLRALEMMLTGRAVDAKKAKKIGLADAICAPAREDAAVSDCILRGKAKRKAYPWWFSIAPARKFVLNKALDKAKARYAHLDLEQAYPAIPALVSLIDRAAGKPEGIAYALEAESLGRLAVTPTCKNLIYVFHLGNALRRQEAVERGKARAERIRHLAVYGAGVMGSGIAYVATKDCEVDLHDVSEQALARGMRAIAGYAKRDPARMMKIRPALDDSGLGQADAVIEAIIEDLDAKRALWQRIEPEVSEDTLLLTNTSSLSVSAMQEGLAHPERVVGMHFFNPAPKMPLVEVVAGKKTSNEALEATAALAARWGKYPVIVADVPGFLVNRCLMPYLASAFSLVDRGQHPAHVDGALKVYGMPMGAFELADRVGLDICLHVGRQLAEAYGARNALPNWLEAMVKQGFLGAKSEKGGFFRYDNGKLAGANHEAAEILPVLGKEEKEFDANLAADEATPMSDQEIVDQCVLPMLVEALHCLKEKVVEDARKLDAAFIYGIGFSPFRGGILRAFAGEDRDALVSRIEKIGLAVPENLDVLDEVR